ncbi:MAG: sigma factor [Pseudomonadota bacterium]
MRSAPEPRNAALEHCARRIAAQRRNGTRETDQEFETLLALLGATIARQVRQYGLLDLRDDAEQCAAIGVHRALETFDPARARFSTHVTWQIRGELQSLRHRVRLDQRRSAKGIGATTLSLESLRAGAGAGAGASSAQSTAFEIVDETARHRAESGASDYMTRRVMERLLDGIGAPPDERTIVFENLYDCAPEQRKFSAKTREQRRQIVRRTNRNCIKLLAG